MDRHTKTACRVTATEAHRRYVCRQSRAVGHEESARTTRRREIGADSCMITVPVRAQARPSGSSTRSTRGAQRRPARWPAWPRWPRGWAARPAAGRWAACTADCCWARWAPRRARSGCRLRRCPRRRRRRCWPPCAPCSRVRRRRMQCCQGPGSNTVLAAMCAVFEGARCARRRQGRLQKGDAGCSAVIARGPAHRRPPCVPCREVRAGNIGRRARPGAAGALRRPPDAERGCFPCGRDGAAA